VSLGEALNGFACTFVWLDW